MVTTYAPSGTNSPTTTHHKQSHHNQTQPNPTHPPLPPLQTPTTAPTSNPPTTSPQPPQKTLIQTPTPTIKSASESPPRPWSQSYTPISLHLPSSSLLSVTWHSQQMYACLAVPSSVAGTRSTARFRPILAVPALRAIAKQKPTKLPLTSCPPGLEL